MCRWVCRGLLNACSLVAAVFIGLLFATLAVASLLFPAMVLRLIHPWLAVAAGVVAVACLMVVNALLAVVVVQRDRDPGVTGWDDLCTRVAAFTAASWSSLMLWAFFPEWVLGRS